MRILAGMAALFIVGTAAAAQPAVSEAELIGVWRGVEMTSGLVIAGEVIFFPDGHYQRVNVLGQLMNYVEGNYDVAGNWLHFVPTDYEPKEYLGVPQYPPPSETWVIDGFDGSHLHATVGASEIAFERLR